MAELAGAGAFPAAYNARGALRFAMDLPLPKPSPLAEFPDEVLLQECPKCDYSLSGLPVNHRCPECGEPFDRRWIFFNRRTMRAGENSETAGMVTLVLLFGLAGYGIWRSLTAIHFLALTACVVAGGLGTWLSDRREGDATLAIGPEGIWVAERNWLGRMRGRRIIPWSDVRKVYSSWVFGEIVIRAREKDARLAWRDVFGSSTHNMAGPRCAKLINTYWERITGGV